MTLVGMVLLSHDYCQPKHTAVCRTVVILNSVVGVGSQVFAIHVHNAFKTNCSANCSNAPAPHMMQGGGGRGYVKFKHHCKWA